ncbi:MAG TPA: hypothetical protein VMN56_03555 [Casimicrobiaceae bacterium]|nr:hypothetical protein [Casimicrobiaceae bacterium]
MTKPNTKQFPPPSDDREDDEEEDQQPGHPAAARKSVKPSDAKPSAKVKRKISGMGSSFGDVAPGMQVPGGKIQSW